MPERTHYDPNSKELTVVYTPKEAFPEAYEILQNHISKLSERLAKGFTPSEIDLINLRSFRTTFLEISRDQGRPINRDPLTYLQLGITQNPESYTKSEMETLAAKDATSLQCLSFVPPMARLFLEYFGDELQDGPAPERPYDSFFRPPKRSRS